MNVGSIARHPERSCLAEGDLATARRLLWMNEGTHLPVVDAAGVLVGMISERDIRRAEAALDCPAHRIRASEVCGDHLEMRCQAAESAEEVLLALRERQLRRMAVVDPVGRFLGTVEIEDLALALLDGSPASAPGGFVSELGSRMPAGQRPPGRTYLIATSW